MPGGFENSAMKSSFSLSSLQPSSTSLETPEHARPERPYNSLRKTCRKDPEKEAWRRSWDRREESKDEFWDALKPNYLYLMDSHLIDSCKEAGRDLQYGLSPSHDWTFEQFCTQFTELDLWLTSIQETIYSKEENVTDRNLRLSHVEEMHRKTYKRKVFNNQGGRLVARFPELKEDVKWRMAHLNRKWERLEQTVTPRKRTHPEHLTHAIDVEHELNCLRKWLRLTERRLLPLNFHTTWTLTELEIKAKEHQVIQREVELHGKIVSSVLKRCDRLVQAEVDTEAGSTPINLPTRVSRFDSAQAIRSARDLERRWQYLYIRSLEWLCHIENQTKRAKNKSPVSASSVESDEGEPVFKHPRLSSSPWPDKPPAHDGDEDLMDVSMSSVSEMVGSSNFTPTSAPSKEDVLNKNFPSYNGQSRREDVARNIFPDDSLMFTKPARHARNHGEFYFKHPETDSEKDDLDGDSKNLESQMETDSKNVEESSEEEWTYRNGAEGEEDSPVQNDESSLCQSTETLASASKTIKKEQSRKPSIEKLIQGVDEIVHASPNRRPMDFLPITFSTLKSKSKVNNWLESGAWEDGKTQGESCDASGEFSTEEEGHSSGDFNTSVSQCHQNADVLPSPDSPTLSPVTAVPNTPYNCKMTGVVMRVKKKEGTPKRPLSESGLPPPQLPSHLPQSRSESALNQMDSASTPTNSVKMDMSVQGTLSSSTTVEEVVSQAQEGSGGGYNTNSLRKRKMKIKKRNLGKKSDSAGSDSHDPSSPQKTAPSSLVRRLPASGTETEEEAEGESKLRSFRRKQITHPLFKLGPEGGAVTIFNGGEKALSADSSFSEQAWDSFQEKYNSEAYSEETPDHETTRQLFEWPFDSQSDGASSLSFSRSSPLLRRRRQMALDRDSPSRESDKERQTIRSIINKAQHQFNLQQQYWNCLSEATPHLVMAKEFEEIKHICREHIDVLENTKKENDFSEECRDITSLIEDWMSLETRSEELQKMRSLQREMATLREELLDLTKRVSTMEHEDLQDREQLDMKIRQIKAEQANLRERKSQLLEINTAVHKFFTDSGQQDQVAVRLKEDVKDLYFVWDETNKRVSQKVDTLSQLLAAWQTFESHLRELQVALREDHNTLRILDSALQEGPVSQDVASSVIDVAKVLSEKQDLCFQNVCALNSTTPVILSLPSSTEGSLSDSGISDSGSEQESERERRLSALRRLARQLEAVLSPNSQAILDMARRIEQTENELRGLQKTCRELIVRTAVCADARAQRQDPLNPPPSALINRSKKNLSAGPHSFMELDPDSDPDPDKDSAGWLWRVIRASLPFHMAILAIICVACLLEPHCCDSMNNLNFSLTPQLRYMRGPPPV